MSNTDQADEPSMEEILASIRKIISDEGDEDNEQPAQAASPDPEPQESPPPDPVPDDPVEDNVSVDDIMADFDAIDVGGADDANDTDDAMNMAMDDFDAISVDDDNSETPSADSSEEDDVSFDEVEALMADSASVQEEAAPEEEVSDPLADASAMAGASEIDFNAVNLQDDSSASDDDVLELTDEVSIDTDDAFDDIAFADPDPEPEPVTEPEMVSAEFTSTQQSIPVAPTGTGAPKAPAEPVISQTTSQTIASSFGNLEDYVFAAESRTIEDLVCEMLHPMLKRWMDENLPSLVERVVRDEVERIARGRRM